MATISEVTDTISKQLLNLVKRIEILEKENISSLDLIELKYLRDQLDTRAALFFFVIDNRPSYKKAFIRDELTSVRKSCNEYNKRIKILENKITRK